MNILLFKKGYASATLEAFGHNSEVYTRIISQSFSASSQVAPYPLSDRFSASVGIFLAGKNDHVILFTQPPGLLEWHKNHHIDPTVKIHEINFIPGPENKTGYPYGSINKALLNDKYLLSLLMENNKPITLITTFPDVTLKEEANTKKINLLQTSDPLIINSKAAFHEHSSQFGYETCPSFIIRSVEDIPFAVKKLKNLEHGVWVKYDGSGGDTVIKINNLTEDNLKNAIAKIVEIINKSFSYGTFDDKEKNKIIEPNSLFPRSGIVVESDIRNLGDIIVNASRTVYTDVKGSVKILEYASQITNGASCVGGRNLFDDRNFLSYLHDKGISRSFIIEKIYTATKQISHFTNKYKYYGIHGQDFFIIETHNGEIKIVNTELNGRVTNIGVACFAAAQAGVEHFLTLDIQSKNLTCNTLTDFKKMVTFNEIDYLNNDPKSGAIWPMAFGAKWHKNKMGNYILDKESAMVRVVILAKDPSKINLIGNIMKQSWEII